MGILTDDLDKWMAENYATANAMQKQILKDMLISWEKKEISVIETVPAGGWSFVSLMAQKRCDETGFKMLMVNAGKGLHFGDGVEGIPENLSAGPGGVFVTGWGGLNKEEAQRLVSLAKEKGLGITTRTTPGWRKGEPSEVEKIMVENRRVLAVMGKCHRRYESWSIEEPATKYGKLLFTNSADPTMEELEEESLVINGETEVSFLVAQLLNDFSNDDGTLEVKTILSFGSRKETLLLEEELRYEAGKKGVLLGNEHLVEYGIIGAPQKGLVLARDMTDRRDAAEVLSLRGIKVCGTKEELKKMVNGWKGNPKREENKSWKGRGYTVVNENHDGNCLLGESGMIYTATRMGIRGLLFAEKEGSTWRVGKMKDGEVIALGRGCGIPKTEERKRRGEASEDEMGSVMEIMRSSIEGLELGEETSTGGMKKKKKL